MPENILINILYIILLVFFCFNAKLSNFFKLFLYLIPVESFFLVFDNFCTFFFNSCTCEPSIFMGLLPISGNKNYIPDMLLSVTYSLECQFSKVCYFSMLNTCSIILISVKNKV